MLRIKKEIINNGIINLFKILVSIIEINIIIIKARDVKIKCFEKKNSNLYSASLLLMMKLMKMKKIDLVKIELKNKKKFSYRYFSNNLQI